MTGEDFSVSVDLKTVNNRFLDIHLRSGPELSSMEAGIKRRIGSRISRGRVDANIVFERTGEVAYELNRPLIAGYIGALRTLQLEFEVSGDPDISALARLPGALQPAREGVNGDMVAGVERAIDSALDALQEMRVKEGEALAREMLDRVELIGRYVPKIETAASGLVESYRLRLQKRIGELLARDGQGIEIDAGRLSQEVAYLADRSDISEEITRLRSHLDQFRETLSETGEAGKRLDFLLQELNREANTVLSKSTDLSIKEAALGVKGEIEKLREQVQNIE